MKIYIVRHGQTVENTQQILQGHLPGNLTEEGKSQIHATAERLATEGTAFKCIVSSDLKRALDSADILAARLHLSVVPMKILRERDWGKYTGMPLWEAREKFWKKGKWRFPKGDTESEEEILLRAKKTLKELQKRYQDDTIIVVTHGQFARNLIAAHLGCSCRKVASFANAEVRTLLITDAYKRQA